MTEAIFQHFQNHIQTTMAVGESCTQSVSNAAHKLAATLLAGNTIYSCGQEHSLPLSTLFVKYLTSGYLIERPSFPALDLETIANSSKNDDYYGRALSLYGQADDALVVFGIGNNNKILKGAIDAASDKGMSVILISARDDSRLVDALGDNATKIATAEFGQPSVATANFLILQCLCNLIDAEIFGGD
jgi:phosphoheptose isomerase